MSINDIRRVLPPPRVPSEAPHPTPWDEVEKQIGPLPTDYKQFIEQYGTGKIDNFIVICNPFAKNDFINLLHYSPRALRGLEQEIRSGSWKRTDGLDLARLKPFGATDNGDRLAWITDGPPDEWGVMVLDSRSPDLDHFKEGMTSFLAAILEGELQSKVFPEDIPSEAPEFTPLT